MTTQERYLKLRRAHPFMDAKRILEWAKTPDASEGWEETRNGFSREVDGFTICLTVEDESIYPREDDGLGHYVQERNADYAWRWEGNYPEPAESFPLGLPYTAFRYSGPGWVQGEGSGYFLPDGVEEQFDYYRKAGQSKSVAWELTRQYVESTLTAFFSSPLTYATVTVTAYKNGVELDSDSMGTSYIDRDDVFTLVKEYDMIDTATQRAYETLEGLCS